MHNSTQFESYFTNAGTIDVDALMAFHRDRLSGFKMELENEPTAEEAAAAAAEAERVAAETAEAERVAAEEAAAKEAEGKTDEDDDKKLSHEDAIAVAKKARSEAADWRTKYRDLEKKFEGAKTPDEIEAVIAEIKKTNTDEAHAMLVENVALKHGLPEDLAAALKGETRDELEAHAKVLAKYAPSNEEEEPEGDGGLNPKGGGGAFDPVEHARQARASRGRY